MRPAKPTCMLLRAELGVLLAEGVALVAVAERVLDAAEEAWLVVAGAVAVLIIEETADEAEATTELVASATLEETETAELVACTVDATEDADAEAEPV